MKYLDYNPKCTLYSRERSSGTFWYINYRLPNGVRQRRPCGTDGREARKRLKVKESQLRQGVFDEKDLSKMPLEHFDSQTEERLSIDKALSLYLTTTSQQRTVKAQYNDEIALQRLFGWIKTHKKRVHIDEVTPLDMQLLINCLDKEGKSEATLKTYTRTMSKVFKWLIEDMELLDMRNPVKKVTIPKKKGVVRERLAQEQEIQCLLMVKRSGGSRQWTPIQEIVQFLAYTGARLGEVLHAEFGDFDLEQGVWHIRHKPKCPTQYGLGWSPKWHKERDVFLFPEAIEVLKRQPRHKTTGRIPVRDESGSIVGADFHPANFVFPKFEIFTEDRIRHERYTRVDNVKKAWDTLRRNAGVTNLQLKDLRTYFNYVLKTRYMFTSKEAGSYLGNSEEVNEKHYTPISALEIREKMSQFSLNEVMNLSLSSSIN